MKKIAGRAAAIIMAMIMTFGIIAATSTAAMANDRTRPAAGYTGRGLSRQTGGIMRNEDRNLPAREAFESRLDGWVLAGLISQEDRALILERFDWCTSSGSCPAGERNMQRGSGLGRASNGGRGRGFSRWN